MAQHDYDLANAAGAAFRSDLNAALSAIVTLNSGTAAPSPTFANQIWIDTTNNLVKKRNNANSGWNTLGDKDTLIATTSLSGLVTALATTTEVLTGANTTKAVTPDALAALWERGADTASASTVSIPEGRYIHITGTTTITDIDFATDHSGRGCWVTFDSALTLTHNGTTLILPTSANITTAAGDTAFFVSEDGSDNVRCLLYQRKDGTALTSSSVSAASQAQQESASATNVYVSPGRQHFHPGHLKAFAKVSNSGTPTLSQSWNVSSLTDNATGDVTVNFTAPFSSATYGYQGTPKYSGSGRVVVLMQKSSVDPTASSCRFDTFTEASSGSHVDVDFSVAFEGDQ